MNITSQLNQLATVCIIDDDLEVCKALKWLLESVYLRVQTFSNPLEFIEKMPFMNILCILLDIRMPIMSGLELLNELKARKVLFPILIISGHGDINMAVRAMKLGAHEFLTKPIDDQYLLDQVQSIAVKKQQQPISFEGNHSNKIFSSLTIREQQVLQHVVTGLLNKQIASILSISVSTVEFHRSNIMRKTSSKTLAELVKNYYVS